MIIKSVLNFASIDPVFVKVDYIRESEFLLTYARMPRILLGPTFDARKT